MFLERIFDMSLFIYILAAILLLAMFIIFPKKKNTKKFGVALVLVAVCLELFVFNFHSYHLLFGDYEETELSLEDAREYNFNSERTDFVSNVGGGSRLEFLNVNKKIGTVRIDFDYLEGDVKGRIASYVDVKIDATDETHAAEYRMDVASAKAIRSNEGSEYIILDLSGEVRDIRFKFSTAKTDVFQVKSITLNTPKPMDFSALRLLVIVGLAFAIYALCTFETLTCECDKKKKHLIGAVAITSGVFSLIALTLTVLYNINSGGHPFSSFALNSGNQITKDLVDAFKAGQVHLLKEPSEEFLALSNPYDWSIRLNEQIPYEWDHLLYNGKYYSYYGIAPVLLLFLPYNLLTGYYFPTPEAVLIFGIVGIVFLSLLFYEIIKRFFPKLPLGIAICSLLILQLSSGIMYCFCSPLFYEIAQASGFMFTMMGGYFLVRSGVVGKGRISKLCLCLSSLCLALAVLCRPTLALYCVVALVFIAFGFFKNLRGAREENKSLLGSSALYLVAALSCFAIIGGIQMAYNYVRFGSILDFGIQYSLTINDFTKSQYHTDFVAIGFWNYLFAFPQVHPDFPFVFSNFSTLNTNGYYFIANTNAIGLFWRALPMFGYFGAVAALKRLDKKTRRVSLLTLLPACVIAPAIIIFSIWESGYGVRYSADFAVELILGALMIIYVLVLTHKNSERPVVMRFISRFFVISLAVAFIANFALIYDYLGKSGNLAANYLNFERIFEFWR